MYKPRYLGLMVLATWIGGFGALIPTWYGQWGRFGLDPTIGSCSILPDDNGRSPKEFLFVLAFVAPCLAIVICYARIFYIVRKTALKSHRSDEATQKLVHSHFKVSKLLYFHVLPPSLLYPLALYKLIHNSKKKKKRLFYGVYFFLVHN